MHGAPVASTLAPHLPFKYVGGDPAIDLVNTVDWTRRGPVDERMTSYERLTRWAEGSGSITPRLGDVLRARAREQPKDAERAHRDALALRWTLRCIFVAIAHGERPPASAIEELNQRVALVMARLQLVPDRTADGASMRWSWAGAGERLDSVLWPVVRSAAELLVSDEATRIHECGAEDCGWQYVDRSRNGLRRWCQMEVCGTREKSRRRASKRSA
jgi:predicted RNA-binding Zn ribbon-like protein